MALNPGELQEIVVEKVLHVILSTTSGKYTLSAQTNTPGAIIEMARE